MPAGLHPLHLPGSATARRDRSGQCRACLFVRVDGYKTLGIGPTCPIVETNGGEALTAFVDGKFVTLHVPYPTGVDGRIDDPNAPWKGRGLWTGHPRHVP